MPMIHTLDQAIAVLISLTDEQIESLPPAERRRVADICFKTVVRCEPPQTNGAPKAGVLLHLAGQRRDE
jgi:hypothetical protein